MSKRKFKYSLMLMLFVTVLGIYGSDNAFYAQQKLIVMKKGGTVYARSCFSQEQDVLISMNKGLNGQINFLNGILLPSTLPMEESSFEKGIKIHICPDDATPWCINGTNIGGNHGCSDARALKSTNHGLTVADIGSEWTDEAGNKFYIVKVENRDTVWILSENKSKDEIWKFNTAVKGNVLKCASNGRKFTIEENKMQQLWPACRIKRQDFMVNGKTLLQEKEPTPCEFLEIVEEYDIISPASLLLSIQNNPGREADFTAPGLAPVLNVITVYRLMPFGVCIVEHKVKALMKFNIAYANFVMTSSLNKGEYGTHGYYIPKTLPFEKDGHKFDFRAIQDFSAKPPFPLYFNKGERNIADPGNLPDRFIQFLGRKGKDKSENDVAFAMGYSLINGLGKPQERAANVSTPVWIHSTAKTYPYAVDDKVGQIPAGREFYALVYRQYFNPAAFKNATCAYWHKEADSFLFYIDYHKPVDNDIIKLPPYLHGKKITVVEKTPSVELLSGEIVPSGGLVLSVRDLYGYLVLKLD